MWLRAFVVMLVLPCLALSNSIVLAQGPDKPSAAMSPTPSAKEAPDKPGASASTETEDVNETCFVDTSQADFVAGSAQDIDLSGTPGSMVLARREVRDQPSTIYAAELQRRIDGTNHWTAQSFKPGVSGLLTRAAVLINGAGTSLPAITLQVHGDSSGRPGSVLAGSTITQPIGGSELQQFSFSRPPALTSGATYYVSIHSEQPGRSFFIPGALSDPYAPGDSWMSANGGATWRATGEDIVFQTHMLVYESTGTLVSAVKDSNPPAGASPVWTNLSWVADVPADTSLKLQVAGSDSPDGPFNFVGPDGTGGSFFTTGNASIAQANGDRYLKYKVYFSTSNAGQTPTVNSVSVCAGDSPPESRCLADSSQIDFQAGRADGLDANTSPGYLTLSHREALDQPATPYPPTYGLAVNSRNEWIAQGFKPSVAGQLTRVAVLINGAGTSLPAITLQVHGDRSGRPGSVLASSTITQPIGGSELQQFSFSRPPALTSGATYYISVHAEQSGRPYIIPRSSDRPYTQGDFFFSNNGGGSWTSDNDADIVFRTYMLVHQGTGTFISAVKDSNPPAGASPVWTNLSWVADVPADTSLKLQVAASDSPDGPFNFVGPDGTPTSYFTTSPAPIRQLSGKRYMKYRAIFFSLAPAYTPRLANVIVCAGSSRIDTRPPCVDVSWANAVWVAVSGNSIRKTGPFHAWDAGAVSRQSVLTGEASVDATIGSRAARFAFGLSRGDSSRHISDIDFALQTDPAAGTLKVVERGVTRAGFETYHEGDVLSVAVESGAVKYYHNGNLLYTSAVAPAYPLLLDSALFTPDAQISNAHICGNSFSAVPNSGVNAPGAGAGTQGQRQQFVTTCSDPDGWRDIHTIDFKLARGQDEGDQVVLWLQFDQNQNLVRFYDPDMDSWREGSPGDDRVLSSAYADLRLAGTRVQGRGPTAPEVDITWDVVLKQPAIGRYRQYLRIEDDGGQSTLLDEVGTWSVTGPCGQSFADVQSADYFHDAVYFLNCRGVVSGYGDSFRPYANTTRGQMVKIIVLARGLELIEAASQRFNDVAPSDPFYRYVETAAANSIVSGYDDGTFRPYTEVTRGQLSKIVVVAMGWSPARPADPSFRDVPPEHPFYVFVETAVEQGIIGGYEIEGGREFRPGNNATRGQIAKIVYLAAAE